VPERDELYTVARTVLLDALEALGVHRDALVLVGAQAIYLRVGEADLAVASYTTDGDLAIDPRILVEIPPLEQKLPDHGLGGSLWEYRPMQMPGLFPLAPRRAEVAAGPHGMI